MLVLVKSPARKSGTVPKRLGSRPRTRGEDRHAGGEGCPHPSRRSRYIPYGRIEWRSEVTAVSVPAMSERFPALSCSDLLHVPRHSCSTFCTTRRRQSSNCVCHFLWMKVLYNPRRLHRTCYCCSSTCCSFLLSALASHRHRYKACSREAFGVDLVPFAFTEMTRA